jgi:WS/DGAT/MGAT family acyltransferase
MSTKHEPLSAQDASFLYVESSTAPMHIGVLAIVDASATTIDIDALCAHVEGRLHVLPRFRQKIAYVPYHQGPPSWVDDDQFDVRNHVHETTIARNAGDDDAHKIMAEIMSMPMTHTRPLWGMWLFDMPGDRKGLVVKAHHCIADGVSGVQLAAALFDFQQSTKPAAPKPWTPNPAPTPDELLRDAFRKQKQRALDLFGMLKGARDDPADLIERASVAARGAWDIAKATLRWPKTTSLRRPVGRYRRFEALRMPLADVKTIKSRFHCKVNDVVLTIVAGGVGHLLEKRGENTEGSSITAIVPVSRHAAGDKSVTGNQVAMMAADLPIGHLDPGERLERITAEMNRLKQSNQVIGADFWLKAAEYIPPQVISVASKAVMHQPLVDVVVTNVPGPPMPLYLLGGELLEVYPFVPLAGAMSLGVAILSYNGNVHIGISGDRDSLPDLAVVREGVLGAMRDLSLSTPNSTEL